MSGCCQEGGAVSGQNLEGFRLAWAGWERVAWAVLLGAVHVAWCEAASVPGAWGGLGGRAGDQGQGQGQVQVASPAAFVFQHFSRCRGTEADAPPDGMGWRQVCGAAFFRVPFSLSLVFLLSLGLARCCGTGKGCLSGRGRALRNGGIRHQMAAVGWSVFSTGTDGDTSMSAVGRSRFLLLRVDPGAGKLRNSINTAAPECGAYGAERQVSLARRSVAGAVVTCVQAGHSFVLPGLHQY